MTNLIGLLGLGGRAYTAHSSGVATVGNNVANASTLGYSRQTVDLSADIMLGGVRADGVFRAQDARLAMQERDNAGALGFASASAAALADLDTALNVGPSSLPESISDFFGSLNELSTSPLDTMLQRDAAQQAANAAQAFGEAWQTVNDAGQEAQFRTAMLAAEANELATTIAAANETLAISEDPALADQRDLAAQQLAELIGGRARVDPDGHMRVVANGGAVMVDGTRAATLSVRSDPADPTQIRIEMGTGSSVRDVTSQLGSGRIGGEVEFIQTNVGGTLEALDQLAFDFANSVNSVHASNQAADGTTGLNLFDVPAGPAGAAREIALSGAIEADPSLLATGEPGSAAGDTQGLFELLAVRDGLSAGGGQRTLTDEAIGILADVGRMAVDAQSAQDLQSARASMLSASRDELSGVSIEEEMLRLTEYQRAAEAASTYVSTIDEMLSNLLSRL